MASAPAFTITGPSEIAPSDRRAVALRMAALDRAAHEFVDPLPGLPIADGAVADPSDVEKELSSGTHVLLATDSKGHDVAVFRIIPHSRSRWQLHRLSVVPSWGSRGVGRAMFDRAESAGAENNVDTFFFHAVVERGKPQIWARRGYRIIDRFAAGDKPLTEVTVERDPRAPRTALDFPWHGDAALPSRGALVSWWGGTKAHAVVGAIIGDVHATLVRHHAQQPSRAALFLGADVWAHGGVDELEALRAALTSSGGEAESSTVYTFRAPLPEVRPYLVPRAVEPRLLALWRFPNGIPMPTRAT